MAYMTLVDYDRNMIPVIAFPTKFAEAYMKCEPGSVIKPELNTIKEGTIAFGGIKIA